MDNQHRKIAGYRELSPAEVALMNEAKAIEARFNGFIDKLRATPGIDQRHVSLAQTHGEGAFMRAVRSIAQPARLIEEPVERRYPFMPAHLERVAIERDELGERREKLVTFFDGVVFGGLSMEEQDDLREQEGLMRRYGEVLNRRLDRAGQPEDLDVTEQPA